MTKESILIVEDEKKIADTLQQGLCEHNYNVEVAYNGTIGYNLFKKNSYNLVILDINLPGLNGYQLCSFLRSVNHNVPILFLTSSIGLEEKIKAYEMGADDYIVKPFEFQELLSKIRVFLKRPQLRQKAPKQILKAGKLEMDANSKEVWLDNKILSLTLKETQLLEYLLQNKNSIVSRRDIALHVWQNDFDTNTNVIDVYVNYLRKKFDKVSGDKLIHTLVGQGYILKDENVSSS